MSKRRKMKGIVAYLLAFCMVLPSLGLTDIHVVEAAETTTVYFYNAYGWEKINAYVYGASVNDPLGGWPGTEAKADDTLGEGWYSVDVPAAPQFSIIFFNVDDDSKRAELVIPDAGNVYVSVDGKAHNKPEDAAFIPDPETTVYFINNRGWDKVYAYVYGASVNDPLDSWPGTRTATASDVGENWYQISVPANAPFNIIFNDGTGGDGRQFQFYIENGDKLYASTDGSAENTKVYATKAEAENAIGIINETVVYFLNNKNWKNVGAYAYGQGEPLGGWPGTAPDSAEDEIGKGWMKVRVPVNPPFSVIFFNQTPGGDSNTERTELSISDKTKVYVTGSKEVYGSSLEAELATGMADPSLMTTVYFYNSRGWLKVNGYTFTKEHGKEMDKTVPGITLGAGWPGKEADSAASEVGKDWWKITIPKTVTDEDRVLVIFNDGVNQTEDVLLTRNSNNYVIPTGDIYESKEAAEEAAKNAVYNDGNESGPNKDIDGYSVGYGGAGANLPYITYEAEAADTNAEVLEKDTTYSTAVQSEAGGRQAVVLDETGDYVEFTLTQPANSLVLRYSMPDSADGTGIDAGLNLYVDGTVSTLSLTSKYAWVYGTYPYTNTPSQGKPHRFFDETRVLFDKTIPAGEKIKLQKDAGNMAESYIIDFIECEQVSAPLTQPAGSLSVTDFGAVAGDDGDDYQAFVDCIQKAEETGKEVWIPEGTFDLTSKKALEVKAVTVRGAGMWYTNLKGEGAAFKFTGTCKFYDFAMTGMATVRQDDLDLAGFEPDKESVNTTIRNIWMEHMKVGVWSANTKNLVIQGCRIRNTYADGINLCSLTNGAVVRNNNVRNTGDDGIAIWPWLADCTGNTIEHNTVQMPMLANGIAVYGGGNNRIEANYVLDIINNGSGICIGSEFDTSDGYHDTTTVSGNLLERCGSYQTDQNYPIGALWIWSTWHPIDATYDIQGNTLLNSSYEGFLFDCRSTISGVTLKNNRVNGATNAVVAKGVKDGIGTGSITICSLIAENCRGELIDNQIEDNFIINFVDEAVSGSTGGGTVSNPPDGDQDGENIPDVKVAKITLSGISHKIAAGKKITLTAKVTPKNATNTKLKWTTSNSKYATVDSKGVVKVKKAGAGKSVTITAKATDGSGVKATYKITIMKNAVTKITLKADKSVKAGKSLKVRATVTAKKGANKTLKWTSSNTKYATVDSKGVVKAKKAGKGKTVTITAQATDGSGKKVSIRIKIK